MNFVKLYKKIPDRKEFSDENLEAAFNKEESTTYMFENKMPG